MSANLDTAPTASATDPNDDLKPMETEEARQKRYREKLKANQKDSDRKISDALLAVRDDLAKLDAAARQKHAEDSDMMCRYVNGDQYGSYVSGTYQPAKLTAADYAYTIPVIKGHVEQSFMQLMRTQIQYEFSPQDESAPSSKELAKMCEKIAVEEKTRLMTRDAQMDEIWNSILAGESYRCLMWGINPEAPKMVTRIDYTREVDMTPDRRECQSCFADVAPGAATCECGGDYIKDIPGAQFVRSIPTPKQVPLAENLLHIPHPLSVQRDLSAQKLKYAGFIIERDYLPKEVAEWRYQTIIDSSAQVLPPEIRIRQEQERASMQTDPIPGSSRQPGVGAGGEWAVREFIYLDVARYGHIYVTKTEVVPDGTPEGKTVKAGTFLGDPENYPDGMFMLVIGKTILKVTNLNLNRRWTEVLYGKRAGSNRGAGMHSLMPLNDIVNDSFNLEYSLGMSGHPFTAINRKNVKVLPEAGHVLFVDNLPSGASPGSVVERVQGSQATGFLAATADKIDSVMQFIEGTYSLQGNIGGPDQAAANTATGVAQVTENASGRSIGPVNQRISADQEMMFQILENIKENCTNDKSPEQYKALVKRFGPDVCELFFNCNFRQTVNINVAENSDTPRSMALTQAKAMAFGQIAQAFATAQVPWAIEVLATIADTLGLPFEIGPGRTDRREAEYRLNKLAAIEERIAAKNPNYLANTEEAATLMFTALAQFCYPLIEPADSESEPVGLFLQDHDSFMDVYKDALFSEQAKTWSQARKNVVVQLWMLHYEAQATRQFADATLQKRLQATLAPQPTPEELAAQQDAEDERAVAAETLTRQADEEAKDADLQRKMDEKEHDAELDISKEQARAALLPPPANGKGAPARQ